jgi:hypothetical protein
LHYSRILPITARIRQKLFGSVEPFERAAQTIELSPAIDREQRAAICLPNELERVLGVDEQTTLAKQLGRMAAGTFRHGATIAYRLDDTILADGSLYFAGGHQVIRPKTAKPFLPHRMDHFAEAQLCTDYTIDLYFGHWMHDGLPLELLAAEQGMTALTLAGKNWLHEDGYRRLTGLVPTQTNNAKIDRLWVIDDRGISENRVRRIQEIRRRIRASVRGRTEKPVFIGRGNLGVARHLVNSDEIKETLAKNGFEIVEPERESVEHIVGALVQAPLVITVEGSAQNHGLFAAPPGATLLLIQPPYRFNALSKPFADAAAMHWAFAVAEPAAGGFRMPVDHLLRTIDEIARVTSQKPTMAG